MKSLEAVVVTGNKMKSGLGEKVAHELHEVSGVLTEIDVR